MELNKEKNLIKRRGKELDKVSFPIRSATQHALEVLGQAKITLKLRYKHYNRGGRDFMADVIVVKGLAHKAIMGLNFLQKYAAKMDILDKKLILFTNGCKSVYSLMEKEAELNSMQVVAGGKSRVVPKITEND